MYSAKSSMCSYQPLRFHEICGANIVLCNRGTVAQRLDGFNHGMTFTSRPVMILEPISFRISETSSNWSGALRIGFTVNDPKTLKSKVPAHSCPEFVSCKGNWVKALPESVNDKDYTLSFYVDVNGDVYYTVGDNDDKFLLSGVQTSKHVWGVIDVYGNTVEVQLMGSDPENEDHAPDMNIKFHQVHGRTAVLYRERMVVGRKPRLPYFSYAFSNRPLKFDEKIAIQILGVDCLITGPFVYGVTSCDPASVNPSDLPSETEELLDWPNYWVLEQDNFEYAPRHVLMFSISAEGKFMVIRDGNCVVTTLHVDTSQPLWLFFKFSGSVQEISMLGSFVDEFAEIMKRAEEAVVPEIPEKEDPKESNRVGKSSSKECVICCEKEVNCVIYRCGHMCLCYECAQTLWHPNASVPCPLCRKEIQDIIKVFE